MRDARNQNLERHSPTADVVRDALGRILASEPFISSPQLSAFLQFIVDETLQGRGADLKGYTIATLALGRPVDFDPQIDPIVRVQAGRVRQAIDEFYVAHVNDPIRINLEKGSYQPRFSFSPLKKTRPLSLEETITITDEPKADLSIKEQTASIQSARPHFERDLFKQKISPRGLLGVVTIVAIVTLLGLAVSGYFSSQIATSENMQRKSYFPLIVIDAGNGPSDAVDLVSVAQRTQDALTRFDDIVLVRDRQDERGTSQLEPVIGKAERLLLRITASPADQGRIRFSARLVEAIDQQVIWAQEFEPVLSGPQGDPARTEIVRSIATTIARPYGVVHAYARQVFANSDVRESDFGCIMIAFDYWLKNETETRLRARNCIEEQLLKTPLVAALHSQLANLYLDDYRLSDSDLSKQSLDSALASANRGARLSPTSARSFQTLFSVYFVRREMESAWRAAEQAQKLNPYDTDILAEVGVRHIQAGQVEKGLKILDDNNLMNFNPPDWVVTYRSIALYMLNKIDQAADNHRSLKNSEFPLAMIGSILVSFREKDLGSTLAEINRLKRLHPRVFSDPKAYFERINLERGIMYVFLERLHAAYVWVS